MSSGCDLLVMNTLNPLSFMRWHIGNNFLDVVDYTRPERQMIKVRVNNLGSLKRMPYSSSPLGLR